jgi:hypothetical protein
MIVDGYERLVRLVAQQTRQLGIAGHADVANAIVSTLVGAVTLSGLAPDPGTEQTILLNAQNVVRVLLQCSPQANIPARKRRGSRAERA